MLALWGDIVGIAMGHTHVSVVRLARGRSRRVVDQQRVALDGASGERSWQAPLAALQTLLPKITYRSADLTISLSNRFVRYVVVPWHDQLTDAEVEIAFARHRFHEIYGDVVEDWEVRVSSAPMGQPRVASALDRELLVSLRKMFARSRVRLRSIQPYLMAAYNRWRDKLDPRSCMFVLIEEQFYTCMVLLDGNCCTIHSGPFDGALQEALPIILDRDFVRSGIEQRPAVYVYAPEHSRIALLRDSPWSTKSVQLDDEGGVAASLHPNYRTAVIGA